jgi:hypothetical protein
MTRTSREELAECTRIAVLVPREIGVILFFSRLAEARQNSYSFVAHPL